MIPVLCVCVCAACVGFCSPKQEDSVCVNMLRSVSIAMHERAQIVYLWKCFC